MIHTKLNYDTYNQVLFYKNGKQEMYMYKHDAKSFLKLFSRGKKKVLKTLAKELKTDFHNPNEMSSICNVVRIKYSLSAQNVVSLQGEVTKRV